MKTFRKHVGLVVPLDQENVDTDAIIPKQFLTSVDRTGFGRNLFDGWRYLDAWTAEGDPKKRRLNPDFALNQPRYSGASILLTQRNFGCGSSREHASWALVDAGFRVIIAPSFADIFCNNCFKNGLLPVTLPEQRVSALFQKVRSCPGFRLAVDLESQTICLVIAQQYTLPTRFSAEEVDFFDIDPFRKDRLLKGLDDVGATLAHEENIRAYEGKYRAMYPWL